MDGPKGIAPLKGRFLAQGSVESISAKSGGATAVRRCVPNEVVLRWRQVKAGCFERLVDGRGVSQTRGIGERPEANRPADLGQREGEAVGSRLNLWAIEEENLELGSTLSWKGIALQGEMLGNPIRISVETGLSCRVGTSVREDRTTVELG